jgi:hypothetical protein
MSSPIVLRPLATNDVWCLLAFASLKTSPTSYILPTVSLNGYLAAGSLPNGTIITSSARRMAPPSVCGNEVLEQAHSRARDGSLMPGYGSTL